MIAKFKFWLGSIYRQLVEIPDTPQRKALGFGLGVFLGIFPGMGPIASMVGAHILRVNRSAALAGSLLTNTWLTVLTLALAMEVGAGLQGIDTEHAQRIWTDLTHDFQWAKLQNPEIINVFIAIVTGFFVISFCSGLAAAGIAYVVLTRYQNITDPLPNKK